MRLIDKTEFVPQKNPKKVKWFPLFLVVVIPESGARRIPNKYALWERKEGERKGGAYIEMRGRFKWAAINVTLRKGNGTIRS